jgi:GT2 family glycosyltransferase
VSTGRDLTIIVPATDAPPTLDRTVAALEAATGPRDEVIVIRAGRGPAAARNAGAQVARGGVLVFVDSDVEVHPDALARIREAFRADPELTAVFGSYDDRPAGGTVSLFRNLLHHHVHQQAGGEATTFWAGLGAVRRDEFLAAGGFDVDSYPTSMMEDIELGMRLSSAGARIVLDPELRATHLKSWSLASMVHTDLTRRGMPWVRMLLHRRELSSALNLGWRHRLTALGFAGALAAGATARHRRGALLLGGVVALNRDFYALLVRRGGLQLGAAGVLLHCVHHLTAVAAVPAGAAEHLVHKVRAVPEAAQDREASPPAMPQPARVAGSRPDGSANASGTGAIA